MAGSIPLTAFLFSSLWISLVAAYSFVLQSVPTQCQTLTVSVTGSGGSPPYRVVVLPFGTFEPADEDPRTVLAQDFEGDSTSTSLQLNYPSGSQFVVVVSDTSGYGSGGTSAPMSVASSSDSSCIPSADASQGFDYFFGDGAQVVQCQSMRIWWNTADVQGLVTFFAAIPAGDAFQIPEGQITNQDGEGTGFSWTPNVAAGTTLIFAGGDDRGLGTGGWVVYQVQSGSSSSCLASNSPSSTSGTPAGALSTGISGASSATAAASTTKSANSVNGASSTSSAANSQATSDSDNSDADTSHKSVKPGVIAGAIIGGIVAIIIVLFLIRYCMRRRRDDPVDESPPDMWHKPDNFMQNLSGTAAVAHTPIYDSMAKADTSQSEFNDQSPTAPADPCSGAMDGSGSRRSFAGADSGTSRASVALSHATTPSTARRQLISVTSGPGMKDDVRMSWV